jgi:hypothetical protein
MEISDIERSAFFVYSIVQYFYRKAYLRKFKNYGKTERVVFIIEESQNVFDSSTISKSIFNRLRKIFSVARNLDLHFILASQRLQDLNTKIRGRTRLLLGQVSLDDYELKIRRLLRHSKHVNEILTLERGSFLYTALDQIVKFPRFEANGKPTEWKPKPKPKPQTRRERLKAWLNRKFSSKPSRPITNEEHEAEEDALEPYENEVEEEEAEDLIEEELFEEESEDP